MPVAMVQQKKVWTLDELHSLPDDGNKYELIDGELFVTPAPSTDHEEVLARLTRLLDPFVAANGLGYVYHPRSVVQFKGSEVEPDLMVRKPGPSPKTRWEQMPTPTLVVEVSSPTTWRRDREHKKGFYENVGIPEYWVVDLEERSVMLIRPGEPIVTEHEALVWRPSASGASLTIVLDELFA